MSALSAVVAALIGRKQTISARVYRKASDTWEDHGIVSETRVGGLIPAIKQLIKETLYGKDQSQSR